MSRVLVTGAAGTVGRALLAEWPDGDLLATDLGDGGLPAGVRFRRMDVTGNDPDCVIGKEAPDVVVHLASIVTPPPGMAHAAAHAVDVTGTRNVLDACIRHKVKRLVVTSSGAAYGYHADNPAWLNEDDALRGNPEFAYADHKRAVETLLAEYRAERPALGQLVFRPGTVLGRETDNQITRLFAGRWLLAIAGSDSPFVFIWDADVVDAIVRGIENDARGIYNMAGDGALTIDDIAARLDKPVLRVPASMVKAGLWIGHRLGLTPHRPQQVDFLRYRPVLANTRLKHAFGFTPAKTSAEVFDYFVEHARARRRL